MPLTSKISADGKVVTIKIDGRFTFHQHREFRETYREIDASNVQFIIDMRNTEYMDSAALGMMLLLRDHAGGDNADIKIINCNDSLSKLIELSNFHKLFNVRNIG